MTDIPIIVPSAGRADAVLTRVSGMRLYVPESQADAYARHNPGIAIDTHPDDAHRLRPDGPTRLSRKRQDIYQRHGSVCMLDDDLEAVLRVHDHGDPRANPLTPDEAHEVIQVTAHNARQADCFLWGWNASPNPRHYYTGQPISLTAYINASAFGLHPSDRLYFSDHTVAAESHWLNLLNAYAHRRAWVDTRFCFAQAIGSTFARPGGQTNNRTLATERADTLFLRRMFGQAVQPKHHRAGASKKLHRYQRAIKNPL